MILLGDGPHYKARFVKTQSPEDADPAKPKRKSNSPLLIPD
jgi:hypothetical protein